MPISAAGNSPLHGAGIWTTASRKITRIWLAVAVAILRKSAGKIAQIRNAVCIAVDECFARFADSIAVTISLQRICNLYAIVNAICNAVAVGVGIGIAATALARCGLGFIKWATVGRIVGAVAVIVLICVVALAIVVSVNRFTGIKWEGIHGINNAVVVIVNVNAICGAVAVGV
jgi:hypothetical protein